MGFWDLFGVGVCVRVGAKIPPSLKPWYNSENPPDLVVELKTRSPKPEFLNPNP